jgi:hypothetical protein
MIVKLMSSRSGLYDRSICLRTYESFVRAAAIPRSSNPDSTVTAGNITTDYVQSAKTDR